MHGKEKLKKKFIKMNDKKKHTKFKIPNKI